MRRVGWTVGLLATLLLVVASRPVRAEDAPPAHGTKNVVKGTIKQSARTGGHAVRDGVLTFGRSTRAFFKHGPAAAKRTWKANAARTKANAKAGGRATRDAAHGD